MTGLLRSIPFVLAALLAACRTAPNRGEPVLRTAAGYRLLQIDYKFSHNTHPDDGFLPGSGVPGSAGTTELRTLHFTLVGGSYRVPMSEPWVLVMDAGILAGPNVDRHKNANDSRGDANAAFVESAAILGSFVDVGVAYRLGRVQVGAQAQLNGVLIQSGWDRFGEFESDHNEFRAVPSIGPTIGIEISESLTLEASVQFGERVSGGLLIRWDF